MKIKIYIFPDIFRYDEDDIYEENDLIVCDGVDTTPELVSVIDADDVKAAASKIDRIVSSELREIYNAPARVNGGISLNKHLLSSLGVQDDYDYEITASVDFGYDSRTILIALKCG